MARISISTQSTEFVRVAISARENGVRVDPTDGAVNMAFVSIGDDDAGPVEDDWLPAEWETDGTTYYIRCNVGPDGEITLNKDKYRIWVRLEAAGEIPVKAVGFLYVY